MLGPSFTDMMTACCHGVSRHPSTTPGHGFTVAEALCGSLNKALEQLETASSSRSKAEYP